MAKDNRQLKTQKDNQQTDSSIGRVYYVLCPDNDKYFRTVRISKNFITGHLQTQVTNPVYGNPPPDMDELPPQLHHRLNSMNNKLPYVK